MQSSDPLTILPNAPGTLQGPSVSSTPQGIFFLSGLGANDIMRMNATTEAYEFEIINNMPLRDGSMWWLSPRQVWIEKLNRIYFFGGTQVTPSDDFENVDSIWYIDL